MRYLNTLTFLLGSYIEYVRLHYITSNPKIVDEKQSTMQHIILKPQN